MQNKYLMILKGKKYTLLILFIVLVVVVYIFYPRSVYSLIVAKDASVENTTIEIVPFSWDEKSEIVLSEDNKKILLDVLDSNYVRIKFFRKKSTSSNFMGYFIFVKQKDIPNNDVVYFFTKDIISVNGKQYKIYGALLAEKFKSIVKSEED